MKCRGKMKGNMGEKLRYKDTLCSRQLCIQMLNTQEQGNEVHVQLAEHWTSNPVVTGSIPSEAAQFFSLSAFGLCLTLSCLPLHIHVQDLIMYMYM